MDERSTDRPAGHPAAREWEPQDPMSLRGAAGEGDPIVMLRCLVEEYAQMGFDARHIARLFETPFFGATSELLRRLGPEVLRRELERVLASSGVMRFRTEYPDRADGARTLDGEA